MRKLQFFGLYFHYLIEAFIYIRNYRTLVNFIPVLRNEHSWQEFVTAGLVSGTLAGYLLCDPVALGFEKKKYTGKFSYRTQCILKGTGYGLIFGVAAGLYSLHSGSRSNAIQLKKWEKYWKQRLGVYVYECIFSPYYRTSIFYRFFFSLFQTKNEKTE